MLLVASCIRQYAGNLPLLLELCIHPKADHRNGIDIRIVNDQNGPITNGPPTAIGFVGTLTARSRTISDYGSDKSSPHVVHGYSLCTPHHKISKFNISIN